MVDGWKYNIKLKNKYMKLFLRTNHWLLIGNFFTTIIIQEVSVIHKIPSVILNGNYGAYGKDYNYLNKQTVTEQLTSKQGTSIVKFNSVKRHK